MRGLVGQCTGLGAALRQTLRSPCSTWGPSATSQPWTGWRRFSRRPGRAPPSAALRLPGSCRGGMRPSRSGRICRDLVFFKGRCYRPAVGHRGGRPVRRADRERSADAEPLYQKAIRRARGQQASLERAGARPAAVRRVAAPRRRRTHFNCSPPPRASARIDPAVAGNSPESKLRAAGQPGRRRFDDPLAPGTFEELQVVPAGRPGASNKQIGAQLFCPRAP